MTWAEHYHVAIPETFEAGREILLTAGMYDPQEQAELPAFDQVGEMLGPAPIIATLTVEP
jgi:hypothetical protein